LIEPPGAILVEGPIIIWIWLVGRSLTVLGTIATLADAGLRIPALVIPALTSGGVLLWGLIVLPGRVRLLARGIVGSTGTPCRIALLAIITLLAIAAPWQIGRPIAITSGR
jgi:hypothetical protein